MRPGYLFGCVFVWYVCCGGRFTAPFLASLGFSESLIGLTFGLQVLFGSISAGYGSMRADKLERSYPGKGRLFFLIGLIVVGTLGFQLHFVIHYISTTYDVKNRLLNERLDKWLLFHIFARLIFATCMNLVFPILDGISLHYLKQINADECNYGKERLFGAVGWACASLIIGPLIDSFGFLHLFFWSSQVGCLVAVFIICMYIKNQPIQSLDAQFRKCTSSLEQTIGISTRETIDEFCDEKSNSFQIEMCNIEKHNIDGIPHETQDESLLNSSNNDHSSNGDQYLILKSIFHNYLSVGFIISVTTLSIGTSVVENLVFLFFQNGLGGSNTLCGFTNLITVLFEIPIFQYADNFLNLFGQEILLKTACLAYVTRVVGYTFIPKEHVAFVLFLEPLHGVTYACAKTAIVDFASKKTPLGFESTGQGIMSMFQGLGEIIGLCLGGWIEDRYSSVILYRSYASIVALGLTIFHITSLMKQPSQSTNSKYSSVSREPDSEDASPH
jgi:Na+/melibiose symporter-like transporter